MPIWSHTPVRQLNPKDFSSSVDASLLPYKLSTLALKRLQRQENVDSSANRNPRPDKSGNIAGDKITVQLGHLAERKIPSLSNSWNTHPYKGDEKGGVLQDGSEIRPAHQAELAQLAYDAHCRRDLPDYRSARDSAFSIAKAAVKNGEKGAWGVIHKLDLTSWNKNEKDDIGKFKNANGYRSEFLDIAPEHEHLYRGSVGHDGDETIKTNDFGQIAEHAFAQAAKFDRTASNSSIRTDSRFAAFMAIRAALKNGQTDALGTLNKLKATSHDQKELADIGQLESELKLNS